MMVPSGNSPSVLLAKRLLAVSVRCGTEIVRDMALTLLEAGRVLAVEKMELEEGKAANWKLVGPR